MIKSQNRDQSSVGNRTKTHITGVCLTPLLSRVREEVITFNSYPQEQRHSAGRLLNRQKIKQGASCFGRLK